MTDMSCPKCGATSGDDWSRCSGSCPMPMSPHYARQEVTTESYGETMTAAPVNIHCVLCKLPAPHDISRWRPRSGGYVCATCSSRCACGAHVEEPTHFDATTGDTMCAACVARHRANTALKKDLQDEAVKKFAERLATSLEQLAVQRVQNRTPGVPATLAEIDATTFLYELAAVVRNAAEEETPDA